MCHIYSEYIVKSTKVEEMFFQYLKAIMSFIMSRFHQLGNVPVTLFCNSHTYKHACLAYFHLYALSYMIFPSSFFLLKHFVVFQLLSLSGSLSKYSSVYLFWFPFYFECLIFYNWKGLYSSVFHTNVEISITHCLLEKFQWLEIDCFWN